MTHAITIDLDDATKATIDRLIASNEALLKAIASGAVATGKPAAEKKAEEKKPAAAEPDAKAVEKGREEVRTAIKEFAGKTSKEVAIKLLKDAGKASSIQELLPENFKAVLSAIAAAASKQAESSDDF